MPVSSQRGPPPEAHAPRLEERTRYRTGTREVSAGEIIGAHSVGLEHGRVAQVWQLCVANSQSCIDECEGHSIARKVRAVERLVAQPLNYLSHGVLG